MWLRQISTSPQWIRLSHSFGSRSRHVSMMSLRSLYRWSVRCCCSTLSSISTRLLSCSSTSGCRPSSSGSAGHIPTSGSCHQRRSIRKVHLCISSCASVTLPSCSAMRALIINRSAVSSTGALGPRMVLRELQSGSFHRQSVRVSICSASLAYSMTLSHWLSCWAHTSHCSTHSDCSPLLAAVAPFEDAARVIAAWKILCPSSQRPCWMQLRPTRVSGVLHLFFHRPASTSFSLSCLYSSARASKHRVS
mmetsp:Transcript_37164/g.104887  ORF Transcript_37164/g.104887 Transcript_37164/m.104887 type:complete len:249 (-) Transcript_37164:1680-2426(-)